MDFSINNRPKLPRNRYGWIGFTGTGSSSRKGGSGLDSKTLNSLYDLIDWFYKDGDFVHSKYSFVGDAEVAAYNNGSIIDGGSYNASWIDASYLYILDLIDQLDLDISIDGSIDLTDFAKRNWVQNNFPDNSSVSATYVKNVSFNSYIETLNSSINQIEKWWWIDGSTINTSFHVVGHGEVNAYGQGPGADTDSYTQQHIDTSYNYIINLIDNISIGGGGEGGTYITDVSISQWNNAANLAHTHGNKAILDGITDSSISMWNETAENLNDWFFFDNDTSSVVTPYNLRSQKEITAYNTGESADTDAYTKEWSDASYRFLMDRIDNISINIDISDGSIDLSGLVKNVSFNKLVDDVCNGFSEISNDITNVSSRVNDLSIYVDTLNSSVNEIEKWWWLDGSTINTSFHIVGHGEVNAYGQGSGTETDSYTQQHIDTSYNYIINLIDNISIGGDITIDDISGFVKDVSFNKLVDDVCNGFSGMSGDINNVSTRVNDLSIYVDGLNVNINDVSTKLNSWFYLDSSGNLNTSLNLIGHKEIMAWGKGDSSEINLAGYVTSDYLEDNYYNKSDIDRKIAEGIDGSIDLSGYVTMIHLEDNYPDNASVWKNYVHNVSLAGLNSSLSEINTSINDISSRVNMFEGWFYKDEHGYIHCSSTFISDYELAAYGAGQSGGEINLQGYAKWVDISSNYYNKGEIDQRFNTIELDDYVKVSNFNTSTFHIDASIRDLRTRIANVSQGVNNANASIVEVSTRLKNLTTRVDNHDTSLTQLNNNLKSTDITVTDLSTRMKTAEGRITDVSSYAISVNTKLDDYFWKDNSGVHCRYNFIGEREVAAFGAGQSGGEINMQGYAKWVDISSNYYNKNEIDQRFNTIELDDYVKKTTFNTSTSEINASIRDLRSRIANVSQGVITINNTINTIQSDIQSLNTTVSQLDDHIYDVQYYAENISTRLKSTNATVADLSTRIKNVSSYAINISTKLNDWFYFQNGKLYTKYDFISEKEICAYKDGSSGQSIDYSRFVDSSTLNNYYTKSEVNSLVNNKMDTIDLTKYATKTWVNTSLGFFATKTWVNTSLENYVQKSALNSSYNELRTYISNNYLSTSSFNSIYKGLIDRIADVSSNAIKNADNLYDVSTLLETTNSSIGRFEEWFELDSAGNVHCKKPFIGNHEVAAYGQGSGSGGGSEIDLAGYVSVATMNSSWVPYFNQKYFYPGKDIDMVNNIIAGDIYALEGNLHTDNDFYVAGNTSLFGDTSINARLYVKNNVSVGGALQVSGKTTVQNVSVNSGLSVTGNTYVGNILTVAGNTSTGTLFVRNAATLNSTLSVTGKATLVNVSIGSLSATGAVTVAGKTTLQNVLTNGNVSIGGGKMSVETNKPVFRLGSVQNSSINSSLYFGTYTRGYINVSTLKDGTDLVDDMTIAAGRNIDLKCENINLVAPTSVDGGLTVNGLITGSGNMKLNSSTAKITIGQKDSKNQYNASIIFGNDANYGYISGYKRITTNSSVYNIDIWAKDSINLSANKRVNVDTELYVDNDITCTGEVISDSDRRLKDDIQPLDFRGELKPVSFDKDGRRQLGFIAQDVKELYPELVHQNQNGYYGLNYPQLTAVLAAQVNEQNKLISALTERLNQIEKLLNK